MQVRLYYIQFVHNKHNIQTGLFKFSLFHKGTNEDLPGGETLSGTCVSSGNTDTTNNNTSGKS